MSEYVNLIIKDLEGHEIRRIKVSARYSQGALSNLLQHIDTDRYFVDEEPFKEDS